MLSFVFQKLKSKKWMVLSLLLGNLLAVTISAAGPMYSKAALQRTLTRDLGNYLAETGRNPGTIVASGSYQHTKKNRKEEFQKIEQGAQQFDQMLQDLGIPVLQRVTRYFKTNVNAKPQISDEKGKAKLSIKLAAYTDVAEHIQILNGEMFSGKLDGNTFDVIVNERTFVEQRLILGEVLELPDMKDAEGEPYRMRIAGIFENSLAQDTYWMSSPADWSNVCLMDQELFGELFANPEKANTNFDEEWYAVADYTGMRGEQAEHYLNVLESYRETFESMGMRTFNVYAQSTLEAFVPKAQKLNTTIWVLLLPIFVLLAAFIFMVSRQMLEMEQNEIAIYKSRGANKKQIVLLYLMQSLCIAVLSLAGGIPLGVLMCKLLGASNSFLEFVKRTALPLEVGPEVWLASGVATLFSVCTMVLPVFKYANVNIVAHKRRKNRKNKRPLWQMLFLDVILLGISIYGLYQYNGQKEFLARKVLDGASLDPLLYFCSSLFMIGSGLLVLRLFPWLIRLLFQLGKRWWSPAMYTSFLRIIRTGSNQGFLMVFLILTVAMGIYNAQAARTINANAQEKIQYITGADIVLQEVWEDNGSALTEAGNALLEVENSEVTYIEPDFGKYLSMDGIKSVTKVLVDKKINVTVNGGKINDAMLMGIHTKEFGETAWFKESLLPLHYHEYLNAISQNSKAILVSSNFQEIYGYKVGDVLNFSNGNGDFMRGIIYGFVDYWPAYAPITWSKGTDGVYKETDNFLIVAHLAQIQASWGVTPYQVWINAKDSSQFIYDYAEETGTKYSVFLDTAARLIELKNDPVFQGTNGILTIGFICILLLCTIGFLIYWILSIQSRTLQFGIFRAMGMSMREVFTMLINEQIFITGVSLGAGILVGILTSKLFVPLIQIAYSSADQVIPMEIISEGSDYVRLFTVIGVVILICMGILGGLISKIKISQALKLGED